MESIHSCALRFQSKKHASKVRRYMATHEDEPFAKRFKPTSHDAEVREQDFIAPPPPIFTEFIHFPVLFVHLLSDAPI